MHDALLLVYTDVEAEHEEAFNRWYDEVHLGDILSVDGFVGARRYRLSGPPPRGQEPAARYLAVYEIKGDDTGAAMKRLGAAVAGFNAEGRSFAEMRVLSGATYAAVGDRQEPRPTAE